eukprot:TRINITY_DN6518_c0_g2_i5.p1 TRINITY_DN6518_c0_g2~~TRINITY_DN6518_c0_g2_i5.p1  ORF type:complete len:280 (-),score=68.04 TRINITY_DN6518_c0_g2_i5:31-870(-)
MVRSQQQGAARRSKCPTGQFEVVGVVDAAQVLDAQLHSRSAWMAASQGQQLRHAGSLEHSVPEWQRMENEPRLLPHIPSEPRSGMPDQSAVVLLLLLVLICGVLLGRGLQSWLSPVPKKPAQDVLELVIPSRISGHQVEEASGSPSKNSCLVITDHILGHGSHGTIVFEGRFNDRRVAVKRMLTEFYHLAEKEIELLIETDEHPSIVRCYAKEVDKMFVYLVLELADQTLQNHMEGIQSTCLLYTSDAADEEDSVDLGGRRIIKKKKKYIGNCKNIKPQ